MQTNAPDILRKSKDKYCHLLGTGNYWRISYGYYNLCLSFEAVGLEVTSVTTDEVSMFQNE